MDVAIIISFISLVISIIPLYYNYLQKNEKIILTVGDGIIRENTIKIMLSYTNKNYRDAMLINSHLMLKVNSEYYTSLPQIDEQNHKYACKWIGGMKLLGKTQVSQTVEYDLPDLKNVNLNNIDVWVITEYISAQGKRLTAKSFIGHLLQNELCTSISVIHNTALMKGEECLISMKI